MADDLGPPRGGPLDQRRVRDVQLPQLDVGTDVRAGRQIVHADDLVAVGEEPVDEMGTDEAGRAGDQNEHVFIMRRPWRQAARRPSFNRRHVRSQWFRSAGRGTGGWGCGG
ncbi:hypothetical protein GCM10010182_36460 [Actinomadura cremea]|nr:hypothetical protein GCM10010182_36460 [Actinomadura cremea]